MSQIRGKNTRPELTFRKLLASAGLRGYRVHYNLPGKPDVVFTRNKLAIFVDGCYWHMCPADFRVPATRTGFWLRKIRSNAERDRKIDLDLAKRGWYVMRYWEHEIKNNPDNVVAAVMIAVREAERRE
jgi:DNA mismatch endonuclease, patch repair protein